MRVPLLVLFVLAVLPIAGQQIVFTFPADPALGFYFSQYPASPPFSPNLPIQGPITGQVQTSPTTATVTLTSETAFLWFAASGNCSGTLTQSLKLTTTANIAQSFSMCLKSLPTWGKYYALISASAYGFPTVEENLGVVVSPIGVVSVSQDAIDISNGPAPPVVITNISAPQPFSAARISPSDSVAWLKLVENVPCAGVASKGSCSITVSPNSTAGLKPGSYAAQIAYDAAGQRAAVSVTYTYKPNPLRFVPALPCRVADTRSITGPILPGGSTRSFQVSGVCNVPQSAQAYSLNVTVVPSSGLGFLSIWPGGQGQPLVSTLNSDGRVKANAVIVPAGTNGTVNVYASDPTDVILDVNGYFVPAVDPSGLAFYPLNPCRVADTRTANGPLGGPILKGGVSRDFTIAGVCGVPANARSYSLNFTAVPPSGVGYLTAWQSGTAKPLASTLNAPPQAVTANAAIIPASSTGGISVYSSDDTHVVIDVNGYFAPPGASGGISFYTLTPCRVQDTRLPPGSKPFSGQLAVDFVDSACALPSTAAAYVTNATVVPSAGLGYLNLWPQGQSQPLASTLNSSGAVTSNMAVVPTTNGSLSSYASDPTYLILDISGYFAP